MFLIDSYIIYILSSLKILNKAFIKYRIIAEPEFSFLMFEQIMNIRHLSFKEDRPIKTNIKINGKLIDLTSIKYQEYIEFNTSNPSFVNTSKIFKAIQNHEKYNEPPLGYQFMRLVAFVTPNMCKNEYQIDSALIKIFTSVKEIVTLILSSKIKQEDEKLGEYLRSLCQFLESICKTIVESQINYMELWRYLYVVLHDLLSLLNQLNSMKKSGVSFFANFILSKIQKKI